MVVCFVVVIVVVGNGGGLVVDSFGWVFIVLVVNICVGSVKLCNWRMLSGLVFVLLCNCIFSGMFWFVFGIYVSK